MGTTSEPPEDGQLRCALPGRASLYATEWYDNDAASFAERMPVAVVAGATTGGIDATLGTPGVIAGRVTNGAGDPIIGVQVTVYDPAGIALQSGATDTLATISWAGCPPALSMSFSTRRRR